ncbi:hypothetical protein [Leptospira mayottensis]|nr:hypothetical protein [Leptospira mayottensis]
MSRASTKGEKSMSRKRHMMKTSRKTLFELLIKTKKSITQISKDLGVSVNMLEQLEEKVSDG